MKLVQAVKPKIPVQLVLCGALAVCFAVGVLTYDVPVAWGTPEFLRIVASRWVTVAVIAVVAVAQATATVLFHTVTENRILTPSILGFDALYVLIHTLLVVLWGVSAVQLNSVWVVLVQCALMVGIATTLTVWLLLGVRAHLHVLLLVGAVFGIGCGSLSNFMQRILSPTEFDVLTARLFSNINVANEEFLPYAAVIVCVVTAVVLWRRHTYDVLALGRDTAASLGVRVQREVVLAIVLVAILVSASVSLVGPLTFYGFLIATLAYQWAAGDRHGQVIPLAIAIGLVSLLGATFIMKHIWGAAGFVTVVIELIGGILFLVVLLKKGAS